MGLGWAAEHRSWNDRQVSTIMKVATLQLGHPDHRYWNKNFYDDESGYTKLRQTKHCSWTKREVSTKTVVIGQLGHPGCGNRGQNWL